MGYERTHYQMLGVDEGADESMLRRAYRRLAKRWHPDLCRDEGAAERFRQVDEAYRCLTDPAERARYDQSLRWRRARSWLETSPPAGEAEGTWVRDVDRRGPARPVPAWQAAPTYAARGERDITKVLLWLLAVGALIAVVAATWPDPIDSPGYGPDGEIIDPGQPAGAERDRPREGDPPRRGRPSESAGGPSHPRSSSPSRFSSHVSPYPPADPAPPR